MSISCILTDYKYNDNHSEDYPNDSTRISLRYIEKSYDVKFSIGKNKSGKLVMGPINDNEIFELVILTNKVKKFFSLSKNIEEIIENTILIEYLAAHDDDKYSLILIMNHK